MVIMDINEAQFLLLSQGLRQVAEDIPLTWGAVQNRRYDNMLKRVCNIFDVMSLPELEQYISCFSDNLQQYYKRRWYSVRLADCDEYLFYRHSNVEHNPDQFDKEWDIQINGNILFDVKSTRIPVDSDFTYPEVLEETQELIKWNYEHQSKGARFSMNNRLFLVHHSLCAPGRELDVRCAWDVKGAAAARFIQNVDKIRFHTYKGCTAGVIFFVETEPGRVGYLIDGLDTELQYI